MPAGFHVASAYVDIHAEDGGLRGEIERAIKGAAAGADAKVKLDVEAAALRGKVESAIKSASAGAKGEVKLDLDAGSLRAKVEAAIKNAASGARGEVKLDLDASSLRARLAAEIRAATTGNKIRLGVDLDTGALRAKIAAASKIQDIKIGADLKDGAFKAKLASMVAFGNAAKINVKMDVDTAAFNAKVRASLAAAKFTSTDNIKIGMELKNEDVASMAAKAHAIAAGIRPKIHVDVDVDRNGFEMWASRALSAMTQVEGGANRLGGSFRNMSGIFTSGSGLGALPGVLVAAGAAAIILGNAIAMVAGAVAAIALPVGIIALGAALQKASIDFGKFKSDLMGFGQQVSASMAPAIQSAMGTVMSNLQQMRGQLTQMFSNAAQLVQPMTQAFMNLGKGALPGITQALQSMQSAMPGIQQGFSSIGQGIGNFFKELTSNGQAVGQVWETMGAGINRVATQLGQSLSQIMSNPANVEMFARTFDVLAQSIQLAGSAITAFAPAVNAMMQGFTQMAPVLDKAMQSFGVLTSLMSGKSPLDGIKNLFGIGGGGDDPAKKLKDTAAAADAAAAAQARYAASVKGMKEAAVTQNLQAVKQAFAQVAVVAGTTGGQIAASLTTASQGANALGASYLKLSSNAQSALGGQIALAQAISQAKSQQDTLKNSLTMTNGQLNLTSTKSQQAATALNQVAQAGVQAATAFANQGNFTAAAAAMDKARSSIVQLGQSFGLSKSQATELANSLLQIPDKTVQFKLNIASAQSGLKQVEAAFKSIDGKDHKVTVTAMTAPAQAALEALGFKIKDLGNGKVEVQANTASAEASLSALKTVLNALATGKHEVSISAASVPAVAAAIKALGGTVQSLPNGDIKITAQDGATTIVHGVKSAVDSLKDKNIKIQANGVGASIDKINEFHAGISKIPPSKESKITASGNAADKAKEVTSTITGIPGVKDSKITASGNADAKAGDVKLKIDGIPNSKDVIVIVNISGAEKLEKLKELNGVNNKAISVQVNVSGTEQLDKLKALNAVNNKNIQVNVSISGAEQIDRLKALNTVNNKNIQVNVSVSGADQVDRLKGLNQVNNKSVVVTVSITGNLDKINDLKQLNSVANKSIVVAVSISGADQISKLKELNNINSKTINVTVNANAGPVQQIKTAIAGISNKTVTISVSANAGPVQTLKSAIAGIANKSVTVTATAPTGAVQNLKSTIASVQGKSVTVTANVNGLGAVQSLISAIAAVQSKTVTVTVNTVKTGSAAGGGLMSNATLPGFSRGGRSMTGGGGVHGIGTTTSDSILARLSNGEFVIRAAMVRKYGPEMLAAINNGAFSAWAGNHVYMNRALQRFATGGQVSLSNVQPGDRGPEVLLIQKALKELYPSFDYSSGPGVFGPRTQAAYANFQRSMGFTGSGANGGPGMQSLIALMNRTSEFQLKASTATVKYIVQYGDTLTKVATKFGLAVEDLVKVNRGLTAGSSLRAGSSLNIPTGWHGHLPTPPPGVIGGTKPGDWNYLELPDFKKIARKMDKATEDTPAKEVSDVNTLMGLAGQNMDKQTKMFENITGTNSDDLVNKIADATDMKSLAQSLDAIRSGVFNALTDTSERTRLQAYLAKASNIEIGYQQRLDLVNKSLEDAKKSLDEVNSAYKSLQNSIENTVSQFATLTKTGKAGASTETMIRQLTKDAGTTQAYSQGLTALQGRGLNGTTLAQIAALGPVDGLRTINSLVKATPEQIAQINALQTQIDTAANKAGTTAADAMYKAGQNAAQGLVDGLTAQQQAIEAAMKKIAEAMKTAILQALGIKSPSRVMHGYGVNTVQGLIQGMEAEGKNIDEIMHALCERITGNAEYRGKHGGTSTATSTSTTGTSTDHVSGDIHIGNIHVTFQCDGQSVKSPEDAQKFADQFTTYIMDKIREENRKRK